MNEITIKTFLTDGTESGEMTMPIDNILSMSRLSFFAKLCRESDEKAGTQAIERTGTEQNNSNIRARTATGGGKTF